MTYVLTDYEDGHWSMRRVNNDVHASAVYISDAVWKAYVAHLDQCAVWHNLLQRIGNEQFEKEQGGAS